MAVIPISEVNSSAQRAIENKRAIADMIFVYKSNMFINEKNYTMRLIENLHDLGYYRNIESIFGDKNNDSYSNSVR